VRGRLVRCRTVAAWLPATAPTSRDVAGYVLAVTTRTGAWQDAGEPLELRRLEVLDTTGVQSLRELLAAALD
jgi:hypothetical protein